jgi:hypothetical protein
MATRNRPKAKVLQKVGEIELVEYPRPERERTKIIEARDQIPREVRKRVR